MAARVRFPARRTGPLLALLFLCACPSSRAREGSCVSRNVTRGKLRLECSGGPADLASVPEHTSPWGILEVEEVRADTLSADAFHHPTLRKLVLTGFDVLVRFSPTSGRELRTLEIYDSHSVFSWEFPSAELSRLTHLVVDNSPLYLFKEEFNRLEGLEYLEIRDSLLYWMSPKGADRLSLLRMLCLNGNRLSEFLRSHLPRPAVHLWYLDLGRNRLASLPDDLFDEMPQLREVRVDSNRLTQLPHNFPPPGVIEFWKQDNPMAYDDGDTCWPFPVFSSSRFNYR